MSDQNRNVGDLIAEANAALELRSGLHGEIQDYRFSVLEQHALILFNQAEARLLRHPEIRSLCAGHYVKLESSEARPEFLHNVSVRDKTGKFVEAGNVKFMHDHYEAGLTINGDSYHFDGQGSG